MPIYEYQCQGCEHEFETIQKMSEAPLKRCPSCGKDLLKKKISVVAFRLKGGGWYETDFKSGDKKNVATSSDSDGSSSADSASSAATKSESKDASASTGATGKTSDGASSGSTVEKKSEPKASGSSSAKTSSAKKGTKRTASTKPAGKKETKSGRGKSKDR